MAGTDEVDEKIASLDDWRGARLSELRTWIREAVPDVEEAVKWRKPSNPLGVPTWSYRGILCTGESYQDKIKLTFARGAEVADGALFNAGFGGNTRRALDIRQTDVIDERAFKALVRAAADVNAGR